MISVLLLGALGGALLGWGLREVAAAYLPCLDCHHQLQRRPETRRATRHIDHHRAVS